MTLQTRLIRARKAKKLTREDLADLVAVTQGCIGHYETGRREPSLDTLVALSNILGVTTDYLLKGEEVEIG